MNRFVGFAVFIGLLLPACTAPEKKAEAQIKPAQLTDELCIEVWVRATCTALTAGMRFRKSYKDIYKREPMSDEHFRAEDKIYQQYKVSREVIKECMSKIRQQRDGNERIEKITSGLKLEECKDIGLYMNSSLKEAKQKKGLEITSKPPDKIQMGEFFEYELKVAYPSGEEPERDKIHFQLLKRPIFMLIRKDTGTLMWMPCCRQIGAVGCKTGKQQVVVLAYDDKGNVGTQEFTIEVLPSEPRIRFEEIPGIPFNARNMTAKVDETILVRQWAGYTTSTLDPVTFNLSFKVTPDDGGIQLESSVVKTWEDKGCTTFFPVYSVTGKKPGRYEVKTTLTVRENGCTGHVTNVVVVE